MTLLWQALVVMLALLVWVTRPPTSLADIARREALRRQMTPKATRVYTNLGTPQEALPPSAAVTGHLHAAPGGAVSSVPAPVSAPAPPAESTTSIRDERWWRVRMSAARETLERDLLLAEAMQSRINALQTDVVNRDDPAQQAMLRQQLSKALAEIDRLRAQVTRDGKTITDIEVEARRLGVPPGWLRGR